MLACESLRARVGRKLAPACKIELRDYVVLSTFTCPCPATGNGIVGSSQLSSSYALRTSIMTQITTPLTTAHLHLTRRGRMTVRANTLAFSLIDESCLYADLPYIYLAKNQCSKDAFHGVEPVINR
jgi:hypothetical protein